MATGYHPERSRVAEGTMADWLIAPVTGSLLEVPGIGPATVKVFNELLAARRGKYAGKCTNP